MLSLKKFNLLIFLISVSFISCNHYDAIQTGMKESAANGKSHHHGDDCMSCHHDPYNGASSSGRWWYFAGTAYNNDGSIATSGTVELWSDSLATKTLIYSVPIDRDGNFFTAKIIDFKAGFYPKLVSNITNADTLMKLQMVTFSNTSCNGCHGHNADGTNQPVVKFR